MEVIGNNLYESRDNSSLPLEADGVVSVLALVAMGSLEVVEECGVDIKLEIFLGLSSGEVKCRKWVRESNEIVIVKKPKMQDRPMPYFLQVILINFIRPKGPIEYSVMAPTVMDSLEVEEESGVDVRLELSLGISSDEVECRKWVTETNEIVEVKSPK
ncbi:hypothetical protein IEQ34_000316 [Dendrobium chrysotoxum]|uniref:Uncharacterized protein n=1 Tax=Dendrobium chrysotoxum TaxID=161865 RepID=A0AAV7HR78_DENCH|nr:hypothetical protein IEQ34_000316 [Dendrobium chrysotoxum]